MTEHIPTQRAESSIHAERCVNCGQPVHLVNRPLGPIWVHQRGDYEWCLIVKAEPARSGVAA